MVYSPFGRLLIYAGATALCAYTIATYVKFYIGHRKAYQYPALQKLCLRICFILPLYSVAMLVLLFRPELHAWLDPVLALYEGYTVFCYFALIVQYAGGEEVAGHALSITQPCETCSRVLCGCTPQTQYKICKGLVGQLMLLKPATLVLSAVFGMKRLRLLGVLLTFTSMSFLAVVFVAIRKQLPMLQAVTKFVALKLIIKLVVIQDVPTIQNMIFDSLHAAGFFDAEIEQGLPIFDPKEREVQTLALLVIVEFALLSATVTVRFAHNLFKDIASLAGDRESGEKDSLLPPKPQPANRRPSAEKNLSAAALQIEGFFQRQPCSVFVHVASLWNVFDEPSKPFMARRLSQFVGEVEVDVDVTPTPGVA